MLERIGLHVCLCWVFVVSVTERRDRWLLLLQPILACVEVSFFLFPDFS